MSLASKLNTSITAVSLLYIKLLSGKTVSL
jgi:hypothetical protein